MKKRAVVFGIVAFILLVISVYVSFAGSCWGEYTEESMDKYMACLDPCTSSAGDCYQQGDDDKWACIETTGGVNCGAIQDAWIADCDAIRKTCTDSCESLKVKCGEETIEEEPEEVPEEEECDWEEYANCESACMDAHSCIRWGCTDEDYEKADIAAYNACVASCKSCEEETPPEEEVPPEEDSFEPSVPEPDDSETLLDAVATEGMSKEKIRSYYENKLNKALWEAQNTLRDIAQERFDKTPPLSVDVVNAKNDYQDALKKGEASEEELAELEAQFYAKSGALKSELNEILRYDPDSVDALWAMAVLNKWQGNNELSYENYRDALVSQQHRNPFQFNDLLDRVRDPTTRMQLMQELLPNENIENVPTTETSPFLKWFDDLTKAPVQQVDKAKRKLAEQIDKLANAFSLFKYLPEKLDEINEQ
jgi:hypothetical protein